MISNQKRFGKEKHPFSSHYCSECKQRKSCGKLDESKKYCCPCYRREILEELEKDDLLIISALEALNDYRSGTIICQCLETKKPRMKYISSDGSGWMKCQDESCKSIVASAGHHGVIKNRNDPRFWGLETKERVLCGGCLTKFQAKMPVSKKYTFNKYVKRGYWK